MANRPFVGFGTRRGYLFELDAYGHPAAPDTGPYTGTKIYGIRGFNLTDPPARIISHFDGDKVAQQQTFPPTDASSGSITIDGADLDLHAIVGNTVKRTLAGIEFLPGMTDQRGNEPNVGILVYQAAKDSAANVGWHTRIVPRTTAIRQDGSFGENNYETIYNLAPSASDSHLWGEVMTSEIDGTEHAGWLEGFAPEPVMVTAFKADGIEDTFAFDVDRPPVDTNYEVYWAVAGVVSHITTNITKSTTNVIFDYPPDEDVIVMVIHRIPTAKA
jgi:hypothetical protein